LSLVGRPMNQTFSVILMAAALAVASAWAADNQATNLDNTILALALTDADAGGGFVVVRPTAELDGVNVGEAQYIKDSLSRGADPSTKALVAVLVDQLFERNKMSGTKKATQLSLASSATNGYVVDYDGKYGNYFRNDGGSWPRFYEENPKARGIVTVSLPAYDEKTGLAVVYKGTHVHGLQGRGELILYKYEQGKLKKLNSTTLWIA
jgi:hypothetical protein